MNLKSIVKNLTIKYKLTFIVLLYRKIKWLIRKCYSFYAVKRMNNSLHQLKKENKVKNILFFVVHESIWKLDSIYKKMESSECFNPCIVICPYTVMGNSVMRRDLDKAFRWFKDRGYNVLSALDDGCLINIRSELNPDVIFYTNPHNLTLKKLQVTSFLDVLSVYVPYTHQIGEYDNNQPQYNQLFHNLMWKIFTTNEMDKAIFEEFGDRKGENVIVSGYPGIEELIHPSLSQKSVWKPQDKPKFKIIWAPHHTIEKDSPLSYSTFLLYADTIKKLSETLSDRVQFALKPHPLLRDKLNNDKAWGKQRTDEYFKYWENGINTQLEVSDYMNLFIQSDSMIHDSGSFLAEYLYVNKPAMYLFSSKGTNLPYNPFGKLCLEIYDKAYTSEDIESFIIETVVNRNDRLKEERQQFINNHLITNDTLPSDFILEYLKTELNKR